MKKIITLIIAITLLYVCSWGQETDRVIKYPCLANAKIIRPYNLGPGYCITYFTDPTGFFN